MELERYFDFLRKDDIRLKGTRIGIETIDNQVLVVYRGNDGYARPVLAARVSAGADYIIFHRRKQCNPYKKLSK